MVKNIKVMTRLTLFCGICIMVGYGSNKLYQALFNIDRFVIFHNGQISQTSCEMIRTTLADTFQPLSFSDISKKIKDSFPFIHNVSIAQLPTKEITITLQPYTPLYVINNELILLESGSIVPQEMYDDTLHSALLHITYEQPLTNPIDTTCFSCLKSVNKSLFDTYNLTWIDNNEILLIDKKQQRFVICADTYYLNNIQKINHCSSLKTKIIETKTFSLEKRKTWFADIRFDNQIIIFSRGGRGHGYTT